MAKPDRYQPLQWRSKQKAQGRHCVTLWLNPKVRDLLKQRVADYGGSQQDAMNAMLTELLGVSHTDIQTLAAKEVQIERLQTELAQTLLELDQARRYIAELKQPQQKSKRGRARVARERAEN